MPTEKRNGPNPVVAVPLDVKRFDIYAGSLVYDSADLWTYLTDEHVTFLAIKEVPACWILVHAVGVVAVIEQEKSGLENSEDAYLNAFLSATTHLLIFATDMPQPPSGQKFSFPYADKKGRVKKRIHRNPTEAGLVCQIDSVNEEDQILRGIAHQLRMFPALSSYSNRKH